MLLHRAVTVQESLCKIWKDWRPQLQTKTKKMRKSNHNLIQRDCPNTPSEVAVENLAQLALNQIHFPDCNRGAEELFSSLLRQGEVDYCCRTNPGRPLAVRKPPLSLTLLLRRSSHYCTRNFNLRCLNCCWQPAADSRPHLSLSPLCRAALTTKHLVVGNKSASQTLQTSPTPARNCCVQLGDKTSFSEVRH